MYRDFFLEPKTVFVLYFLANLFIGLLICAYSFFHPAADGRRDLRDYGYAKLLLAAGWSLFFLRGFAASLVTVNFSNSLVLFACCYESLSLLRLTRNKPGKLAHLIFALTLAAVFTFNICVFLHFNISFRIFIVNSFILIVYLIPISVFFIQKRNSLFERCFFFSYVFFELIVIAKIVYNFLNPSDQFFSGSSFECIYNILLFLLALVGAVGFLLVIKERQDVKIRKLLSDKNKFFAVIAHDLRGPLGASVQLSEMVVKEAESLGMDEMLEMLFLVHESNLNTYKLLDNLLNWSKLQTGELYYAVSDYKLSALITQAVTQVGSAAISKNIVISLVTSADFFVRADKNMIESVMRNLLTNAIKFTGRGGVITIAAEKVGRKALVSIADNGIGMPAEIQQKIFKTGSKILQKGTENEQGTGLGLLLCSEFVRKNNGEIWFESEPGTGSVFKFTLPLSFEINT